MILLRIREETAEDFPSLRQLHTAAFRSDKEADLLEALGASNLPLISLVAEQENRLAGHILFSPVRLEGWDKKLSLYGMGPLAVLPERQKQGIGSALVTEGLNRCRGAGIDAVVVLGHPDFYPRFGFEPSRTYGIRHEYDVPDPFFMIRELNQGCLKDIRGTIIYHESFKA